MSVVEKTIARPKARKKTAPKFELVPVIFANGIDDDTPGLAAAFHNEKVHYGAATYEVGDDIFIRDQTLAVTGQIKLAGQIVPWDTPCSFWIVRDETRVITVEACVFVLIDKADEPPRDG